MSALQTVDVRDMLCAQALAVVARAAASLHPGDALDIRYNAEDVKADLRAWAREARAPLSEIGTTILRLEHTDAAHHKTQSR